MKHLIRLAVLLAVAVFILAGWSCGHEHTELRGEIAATCTEDGATGETFCLDCQKVIRQSGVIPALGHDEGTLRYASEPTCQYAGYTGDVVCNRCGAVLKAGEPIPALAHVPGGDRVNAWEASCSGEGYTGDIVCVNCGTVIEEGERIPKLEHVPAVARTDVREATCTQEGYTGDVRCANCNVILESGEVTPMLPHRIPVLENVVKASCTRAGYTGEGICSQCGQFIEGDTLPMLDHAFDENGICAVCGWKTPGLYIDGQLAMGWDELVSIGYITLEDDNTIKKIGQGLQGTLVVSESIEKLAYGSGVGIELPEIWLPRTVTVIGALHDNSLERVRIFGAVSKVGEKAFDCDRALQSVEFLNPVEELDYGAFRYCESLVSITLPEGLQRIRSSAFNGCVSLERIDLPQSLKIIGVEAFRNCSALQRINLPEGLTEISGECFKDSGLMSITAPSTLEKLEYRAFSGCDQLTFADLSACKVSEMKEVFAGDEKLTAVKLPGSLVSLKDVGIGCECLNVVEIPEGVTEFRLGRNNSIETIIWPESLLEGAGLEYSEKLTTIHYRGSELRWTLVANKGEWTDHVTVDFDYSGGLETPPMPEPAEEPTSEPAEEPTPEPAEAGGTWTCENGHEGNTGKFCIQCGAARPEETGDDGTWTCENGHEGNTTAFCPLCGAARPEENGDDGTWTCENGHEGNTGKFCTQCGAKRP